MADNNNHTQLHGKPTNASVSEFQHFVGAQRGFYVRQRTVRGWVVYGVLLGDDESRVWR